MAATKRLARDLYVGDVHYPAGTKKSDITLPKDHDDLDSSLFQATGDDDADTADPDAPPPKSGRGSGAGAWADYADEQGVDVPEGAGKPEIIAALEAAGKRTE